MFDFLQSQRIVYKAANSEGPKTNITDLLQPVLWYSFHPWREPIAIKEQTFLCLHFYSCFFFFFLLYFVFCFALDFRWSSLKFLWQILQFRLHGIFAKEKYTQWIDSHLLFVSFYCYFQCSSVFFPNVKHCIAPFAHSLLVPKTSHATAGL